MDTRVFPFFFLFCSRCRLWPFALVVLPSGYLHVLFGEALFCNSKERFVYGRFVWWQRLLRYDMSDGERRWGAVVTCLLRTLLNNFLVFISRSSYLCLAVPI